MVYSHPEKFQYLSGFSKMNDSETIVASDSVETEATGTHLVVLKSSSLKSYYGRPSSFLGWLGKSCSVSLDSGVFNGDAANGLKGSETI